MLQVQAVDFKSDVLEVISQGISFVSVNRICSNIGLDRKDQVKKIKSDDSYKSKYIEVQTISGIQNMFCIPLSRLNGWLFSINPNKVKPEIKQKLIDYKNECFDVLNNYFNTGVAINPKYLNKSLDHMISGYKSVIARRGNQVDALRKDKKLLHEEISQLKNTKQVVTHDDSMMLDLFKEVQMLKTAIKKQDHDYKLEVQKLKEREEIFQQNARTSFQNETMRDVIEEHIRVSAIVLKNLGGSRKGQKQLVIG